MYATDFKYGGKKLSDYNCIICDFDASSGASFISLGAKISFHTQSINKGKKYSLLDTTYDDCLQCTFDICKNPDLYDGDAAELTKAEYKRLVRAIQGTQSCYIMQVGLQAIFTEAPKQKSVKNKCCFPEVQFVNHGCNVGMGQ